MHPWCSICMQGGSTSCRGDVCLYPWVLCLLQGGLYLHPWVLCLLQGNSIYTHGTLLAPEGGLPTPMGALSAPRGVCLHPVGVYHLQGGCLSAPTGALPAPGGLRLHPWVLPPHLVTPPKTHRGARGCRPHAGGSSHSNRGDSGGVPRKKNGGGVCVTVTLRSPNTPRVGGGGWGVPPVSHLPQEELDTAHVALDAGAVQGGLAPLVPTVPLWRGGGTQ